MVIRRVHLNQSPHRVSLKDRLVKIGVVNTYDILKLFGTPKKDDVAVDYYPPESRQVRPPRSRVYSPSHKTDPGASWYDNGMKTFSGHKDESFPLALEWATKTYGITEWVPDPTQHMGRIPKAVRERAVAAVKKFEETDHGSTEGPRPGG